MSRGCAIAAAVLVLVAAATRVGAHSQPWSWVELVPAGRGGHGSATAHVVDLAHVAGIPAPDSLLSERFLAAHAPLLRESFAAALRLEDATGPVTVRIGALATDPARQAVRADLTWTGSSRAGLTLARRMFTWEDVHETFFNVRVNGRLVHQDLLDARHARSTWRADRPERAVDVAARFAREGIHHIFIGPDHVLFIIGLVLLGGGIRRLARIVTAFTLAHSITLALATLGWVTPPARVVEPLIAASIAIIGIENLRHRPGTPDRRAWLAFGFGLVHGFGFASVLRELDLPPRALGTSLLAFNAGVELGQLAIVLAVAPLLGWIRARSAGIGGALARGGSWGVIAAGCWWLVERLLAAR